MSSNRQQQTIISMREAEDGEYQEVSGKIRES